MTVATTGHRRSIRIPGYDYSRYGTYFVTICTNNRTSLFGEIIKPVGAGPCARPEMKLNAAGQMIQGVWNVLPVQYDGIEIDAFVVMPNHVHDILVIKRRILDGGRARGPAPTGLTLPDVLQRFKSMTTKKYIDGIKQSGWTRFDGKLWQRGYYEHIIRGKESLRHIQKYINDNPERWEQDRNNPAVVPS
jgi:putative transposase